jgi:hypothetical protein
MGLSCKPKWEWRSTLIGVALAQGFEAFGRVFEELGGAVEEEVGAFDGSCGAVLVFESTDDLGHGAGSVLLARATRASSQTSSSSSLRFLKRASRILGESKLPRPPRPKVAQSRTSLSLSLMSLMRVETVRSSSAKQPRVNARPYRTSASE